jgi:hypothetical protein
LQAIVGDDAFHAADADGPSALDELLGDDLRRSVGVEKAVTDHLPDELGRPTIVGFRATLLAVQSDRPLFAEGGPELKIALFAEVELLRGLEGPQSLAFAFHEHQQLPRDLVIGRDLQLPGRSDQRLLLRIELCHDCLLHNAGFLSGRLPADCEEEYSRCRAESLIKYGATMAIAVKICRLST